MIRKIVCLCICFICFRCSTIDHKKEYYDNGVLKSEWTVDSKGLKEGEKKSYYQNGKLEIVNHWVNDSLEGEVISYFENGNIKHTGMYKKGQSNGQFIFYFDSSRKVKQKSFWINGMRVGEVVSCFDDSIGGVEKEYFINFHGKETSLGWYAVDQNGNIYNESRRVHFESKTDTVSLRDQVEFELELRKSRFDHTQFIIGNYNDRFFLTDSSSLDTLDATNQKAILRIIPKQKGENSIRGFARNYNSLPNGYYEQINPVYFEKKYFVK